MGEPGDGRETAAIALHSSCELRVHAISLEEKPRDRLARTFPVPGVGYLVDLSSLGRVDDRVVRELRALKTRVVENDAALTVLTRPGAYAEELPEAPVFRVRRPRGTDVFSAHVGHFFEEGTRNAWLTWAAVRALMDEAAPADAARLASIAYRTRSVQDDKAGMDTWIREAVDAYGDWRSDLDGWFRQNGGDMAAWNRIVLIASAVLEGHRAQDVFSASDALARELGVRQGDAGGLTGLGVEPTLEDVGAVRTADGCVRFGKPEYAAAVIDYVWDQLPRIRDELLAWSSALVATSQEEATMDSVREAWTRLALRRAEPLLATRLFDLWAGEPATRAAAVDLAAEVASSPEFGQAMRKRLYDVARRPPSDRHALTVARTCAVYGRAHPTSALFRLKWLAQADSEGARRAVLISLEEMSASLEQWFETVHLIVNEWCHEGVASERREVARRFLARSLGRSEEGVPELLLWIDAGAHGHRERAVASVADMWGAIFDRGTDGVTLEAAGPWISCALEAETRFEQVSDVFVRAVTGRHHALSGERMSSRTVTAGKTIIQWCEYNGVDHGTRSVHRLLARLYTASDPLEPPAGEEPGPSGRTR